MNKDKEVFTSLGSQTLEALFPKVQSPTRPLCQKLIESRKSSSLWHYHDKDSKHHGFCWTTGCRLLEKQQRDP